jgi:predicted transcriptional regulator
MSSKRMLRVLTDFEAFQRKFPNVSTVENVVELILGINE